VSITGEVRQQIVGVMELNEQARTSVEEAGELVDAAVRHLTAALSSSRDPQAAQAVRSLLLAQERLAEISGLFGWVAGELPGYLARLAQAPGVQAGGGAPATTSHRRNGDRGTSVSRPGRPEEPEPEEEKPFMGWWGSRSREIEDAGTAESFIGEAADRIFTDGPRGVAIRFGKGEPEQAPLRVYIDRSANRAAVSWQGSPGVESGVDPDKALVVEEHPKRPPVTIPPERARVTPATAIRAAREYVETGRRPTCLDWNAAEPPPAKERVEEIRAGESDRP
jgi:immunity protein Imm1 of predicted polymorphic toxin system